MDRSNAARHGAPQDAVSARSEERALLHEVADAVGALMEFWGFKRIMGRVWTLLYLRDEPLSMADLCEQLEISTGAVKTHAHRALTTLRRTIDPEELS